MFSLVDNLFVKKNPLQDLLSSLNADFPINKTGEILKIIAFVSISERGMYPRYLSLFSALTVLS